jgi:hypothetical protein
MNPSPEEIAQLREETSRLYSGLRLYQLNSLNVISVPNQYLPLRVSLRGLNNCSGHLPAVTWANIEQPSALANTSYRALLGTVPLRPGDRRPGQQQHTRRERRG